MDISPMKTPVDLGGLVNGVQSTHGTQPAVSVPSANPGNDTVKSVTSTDSKVNRKKPDLQEITKMTDAMNKFVEAMDANIRFTIHQKTKELMVQVVDKANNKVLKEFPSHEFLDTIAAIRSYVGILLDKKI